MPESEDEHQTVVEPAQRAHDGAVKFGVHEAILGPEARKMPAERRCGRFEKWGLAPAAHYVRPAVRPSEYKLVGAYLRN
jgi:hypothetical protein